MDLQANSLLFNPDYRKKHTFSEANEFFHSNALGDKVFKGQAFGPFIYWWQNYEKIVTEVSKSAGFKLRVSIGKDLDLLELSRILPFLCDHVVFSPPPLWRADNGDKKQYPEFSSTISCSYYNISVNSTYELFSWLVAVRPLIENNHIIYLPRPELHASYPIFDRLKIPILGTPVQPNEVTFANQRTINALLGTLGKPTLQPMSPNSIIEVKQTPLEALFTDHLISSRMDCLHSVPSIASENIATKDISSNTNYNDFIKSQIIFNLKVPYIQNVSYYDLSLILKDEYYSVKNFRESIISALKAVPDDLDDPIVIERIINKIQRDIIDDPLRKLNDTLKRITKYESLKMAGYALSAATMLVTSMIGNGALEILTKGIGTVNLIQIFGNYVQFLEKKATLKDDSIYWIYRLQKH